MELKDLTEWFGAKDLKDMTEWSGEMDLERLDRMDLKDLAWSDVLELVWRDRVLEANNVLLYSTENEEKSSVVERWNRTMKNIMWKYFTANNTQKYIDVLPSMIDKYNSTDARNPSNYQHVHNALYANVRKASSPKFHVGHKYV